MSILANLVQQITGPAHVPTPRKVDPLSIVGQLTRTAPIVPVKRHPRKAQLRRGHRMQMIHDLMQDGVQRSAVAVAEALGCRTDNAFHSIRILCKHGVLREIRRDPTGKFRSTTVIFALA